MLEQAYTGTPESQFKADRYDNFNRGVHGDVDLLGNPEELFKRELEERGDVLRRLMKRG